MNGIIKLLDIYKFKNKIATALGCGHIYGVLSPLTIKLEAEGWQLQVNLKTRGLIMLGPLYLTEKFVEHYYLPHVICPCR